MKKYLVVILLMVGFMATAQNGEVFSVLKLEPRASAPTNAFWTNGSLYRNTDGTIYHKVDGSWEPLGGTAIEIVNNLTSTDTDKALSAAQGKVLQDGLDLKADDSSVMHLTGNESALGQKDFSDVFITVPKAAGIYLGGSTRSDNVKRWMLAKSSDNFVFALQNSANTNISGTYTDLYTLNSTGVPTNPTDLADKAYVDSVVGGGTDDQTASEVSITDSGAYFTSTDVEGALQELGANDSGSYFIKKNIRIATTENITLSGLQVIDGNTTAEGERVLVKDQTDPKENGIYIASSGSWSRSTEANSDVKLAGTYIYVTSGGTMYNKFFQTDFSSSDDIGSDDIIFTEAPFDLSGGGGTDDQTGAEVNITDSGDYYTGTNVEAALQEVGADLADKIGSDTSGRTSATAIENIYEQDYDDYISDGAPAAGTFVLVPGAPPAESGTSATNVPLDGYFLGSMSSANSATAYTTDASLRRAGGVC